MIRIPERDTVLESLKDKQIYCGIHYPIPIHLTKAYEHLGFSKGSFPVAETCADQQLSLPMYPELRKEQVQTVVNTLITIIGN